MRWSWRDGRNHIIICEEWRHPGSVKIFGKTMSLLIGPDNTIIRKVKVYLLIGQDNTFIRKGSVLANRAGHYIN